MGLFDIFSGDASRDAAAQRTQGLTQGYGQLSGLYGQGREAFNSSYDQGMQPLQQVFSTNQGGSDAYADATGANGPEGLARARSNFQASPGFDFQLNKGVDALSRAGAAKGLASGNVLRDAQEYGTGLANQDWGNYVKNLSIYPGLGASTAGAIGGLGASRGAGLLGSYQGQGGAANQTQTGIGDANAAGALADYNASGNMWGALMGGGRLAAGALGQSGGLGNTMSNLGSSVGGGLFDLFRGRSGSTTGVTPPGYAEGGRPPVGEPSLVGEQGPEMFVPDQPGTIVPDNPLARQIGLQLLERSMREDRLMDSIGMKSQRKRSQDISDRVAEPGFSGLFQSLFQLGGQR